MKNRLRRIMQDAHASGARLVRDDGQGTTVHPIHILLLIEEHDKILKNVSNAVDALENGEDYEVIVSRLWPIGEES